VFHLLPRRLIWTIRTYCIEKKFVNLLFHHKGCAAAWQHGHHTRDRTTSRPSILMYYRHMSDLHAVWICADIPTIMYGNGRSNPLSLHTLFAWTKQYDVYFICAGPHASQRMEIECPALPARAPEVSHGLQSPHRLTYRWAAPFFAGASSKAFDLHLSILEFDAADEQSRTVAAPSEDAPVFSVL
jgi:hypothetical protein